MGHGGHGKAGGKGKGAGRKPKGGRGGTHPWINSQIIQASEAKDVHHLMSVIMQHLPQMNLVNLSTAIHRVAKIVGSDPWQQGQLRQSASLDTLLNSVCTALNVVEATEVQPQSVSNVVWSLATLRIAHRPLLQVVSLVCVSNMAQFKSFELSTTLWALAKLGSLEDAAPVDKAVFYAAATHIHNNANEFGFRCLATTAWAFATARQRHARLFRSMAAAMLPAAAGANCQEMANTAWAFGTADFHDDALFHELAEQAMHRLEEFKPQEISNMLWGFATNSFFHEAFYARASVAAQKMDLQSQHLANILWAFARVRPKHPLTQQTVLNLLPLCTQQLQSFKPQEVSSTLLATAKAVGNSDEMSPPSASIDTFPQEVLDFFHACLPWVVARLREFSEQSLANSVSAYAMVPVRGSDTLVDCSGKEVLKRMKELDVNALVHLLKGFMLVPTSNGSMQVVKALAEGIAYQLDRVRAQEMQSLGRLLNRGTAQQRELDREEIRQRLTAFANVPVTMAQQAQKKMPATELFPTPVMSHQPPMAQAGLQPQGQVQVGPQGLTGPRMVNVFGNSVADFFPQESRVGLDSEPPLFPVGRLPESRVGLDSEPPLFPVGRLPEPGAGSFGMHLLQDPNNCARAQEPETFGIPQALPHTGFTSVAPAPAELPEAPPLPSNVQGLPQALGLNNMPQQDIFPQARRQQLSQIRLSGQRGGSSKNQFQEAEKDKFLHQHPICPISESSMMAAQAAQAQAADKQKMGNRISLLETTAPTLPDGGTHPGFRIDPSTGATLPMPMMHEGFAQQQMMSMTRLAQLPPAMAGSVPATGYPNPMTLMPATSLGGGVPEEHVGERSLQMVQINDQVSSRSRRNMENSRHMFVKNSFLHVEDSDDEEDDHCDGTSSHRSSSMPSSMGRDYEDRPWGRQMPSADMLELLYSLRKKQQGDEQGLEHASGGLPPAAPGAS